MTDRELLELAAKSCRLPNEYSWDDERGCMVRISHDALIGPYDVVWNPLEDAYHALWMACQLSADIFINQATVRVEIGRIQVVQDVDGDKPTAARRAIVRAAAEIGRGMG